jgi:hypothetical protein
MTVDHAFSRDCAVSSVRPTTATVRVTVVTSPSLTMSAVLSTFSSALMQALTEERHSAVVDGLRFSTWARFESFGTGTRSDPAISSITYCDQDSLIRTPSFTGERDAQLLRR